MSKLEYLQALNRGLKGISSDERHGIVQEIDDHISESMRHGVDEQDVLRKLGGADDLAKHYRAVYAVRRAEATPSLSNLLLSTSAVARLSLAKFLIISPLFLIWVALSITLCVLVFPLGLYGLAVAVAPVLPTLLQSGIHPLVAIPAGLGLLSFACWAFIAFWQLNTRFYGMYTSFLAKHVRAEGV